MTLLSQQKNANHPSRTYASGHWRFILSHLIPPPFAGRINLARGDSCIHACYSGISLFSFNEGFDVFQVNCTAKRHVCQQGFWALL
jgi:hypothetical protein